MENGVNLDIVNQTNERREALTNRYSEIKTASDEFIKGTNHPDGAFHDFRHFINVAEAAKQLLKAAQGDEMNLPNDPTHFWESLERFCRDNGFTMPDRNDKELEIVMEFFGMTHDLGNSFAKAEVVDKKLIFTPLVSKDGKNQFRKVDAEKRSIEMIDVVVGYYLRDQNISDEKKLFITKLVKELTAETTFNCQKKELSTKPFAVFSRIADQIGQALVDENPENYTASQRQLLDEEINDEKGFKGIDAKKFGNFIENQLGFLTSNDTKAQQDILKIFTDGTDIPKYLIYKDDDPRLKELKLHPLSLIFETISKLEANARHTLSLKRPSDPIPLRKAIRGSANEVLAKIALFESKEPSPTENEMLDILQNPEKYGLTLGEIPRNPDLIKIKFDERSGSFYITEAYEAKTGPNLDMRACHQLGSSGDIKGMESLCKMLNRWSIDELKTKKLPHLAEAKIKWLNSNGSDSFMNIDKNFTLYVVTPNVRQERLKIKAKPANEYEDKIVNSTRKLIDAGKVVLKKLYYNDAALDAETDRIHARYTPPEEHQKLYLQT